VRTGYKCADNAADGGADGAVNKPRWRPDPRGEESPAVTGGQSCGYLRGDLRTSVCDAQQNRKIILISHKAEDVIIHLYCIGGICSR